MIHGARLRRRERKRYKEPPESLLRASGHCAVRCPRIAAATSEVALSKLLLCRQAQVNQSQAETQGHFIGMHRGQALDSQASIFPSRTTLSCRGRICPKRTWPNTNDFTTVEMLHQRSQFRLSFGADIAAGGVTFKTEITVHRSDI